MIAFALSGGGNRGPLQVGALAALLEHGIRPNLVVGTSAGAINAVYLAVYGPDADMHHLAALWRQAKRGLVYPGNPFSIAWRVLIGADSLFPNFGMRQLIERNLPPGVRTFGDLKMPCYVTAADLQTSRLYLFGDDPAAPLVEAVLASASVPGIHPPVEYHGLQLVDGGVIATVPASVAMDKGATTIYVINVGYGGEKRKPVHGFLNILKRTLDTFIAQSIIEDLDRAAADPTIALHHIHITAFKDLPFNDFEHTDEMIEAGYKAAKAYLKNPQPYSRDDLLQEQGPPVPGVTEYYR